MNLPLSIALLTYLTFYLDMIFLFVNIFSINPQVVYSFLLDLIAI